MSRFVRVIQIVQPIVLVALPVIMLLWAWLKLPNAALVTSACACAALVPFFVGFEKSRRRARDLMPVVVLTALAVAGRLVFAPVPAIKPIVALVVMGGLCFGKDNGFMIGALAMLVSNVFFGQGPWTPWQMFSMGLVGYLAGVMGRHGWLTRRWSIAAFGASIALLYGFILDTWTIVGFVSNANTASVLTTYAAGLVNNVASAMGTVAFLVPIAHTWPRMFGRIKKRYQIG
ncbi:MAG: ECF transporter S component [Atopobiaceae bacterium]|nr:ECF transporter S component [Atopobiaceae bacterium]